MVETCVAVLLNLCLIEASALITRVKIGECLIRVYCQCLASRRHKFGVAMARMSWLPAERRVGLEIELTSAHST